MARFHALRVSKILRETPFAVAVELELPDALASAFDYRAGQYLTFRRIDESGEEIRRSYSICSAPHENVLRVGIKKVPGGRFSTYANDQLKVDDILETMPPMGRFTLPESGDDERFVAFAAGSGITPVLSILKTALARNDNARFLLFYGNRRSDSIMFKEEIEALKNRYIGRFSVFHLLSQEKIGSLMFEGRLDAEKCRQFAQYLFDPSAVTRFFLCGPEAMIFDIRDALPVMGVSKEAIKFELFTTAKGSARPAIVADTQSWNGPTSQVRVRLDGNVFEFPVPYEGPSVLEAALKAGADLPFSCQGGVCSTCRAKLKSGEVSMDVHYALEDDELQAGFILTCQAHPRSDYLTVDFDEK